MHKENKELKEEIKDWEKHIGDVKREDLDKVFKMSIYVIAESFEYYRKKIKENHLNTIEKENEQLKSDNKNYVKRYGELFDEYTKLKEKNKELKIENDLLSDELEQAKAVINKKWNEYLKKKELI